MKNKAQMDLEENIKVLSNNLYTMSKRNGVLHEEFHKDKKGIRAQYEMD